MEESGSEGLDDFVFSEKEKFFADVDFVCISDSYWLGTEKPCIGYGLRGMAYFGIEVHCAKKDLHSGQFGGAVHDSMSDLVALMGSLACPKTGQILVKGIYDSVRKLTDEENKLYEAIDFKPTNFGGQVGIEKLLHENKSKVLQSIWRNPSLTLHGIEGAWSGAGPKTVIPCKVIGKFSIRLVPDMDPHEVEKLVKTHLEAEFAKLDSPNRLHVYSFHGAKAWLTDVKHPHYQVGIRATERVYKVKPDLTREGGSIPVTLTFESATGKSVMLLPMGQSDDGAHSQNEKLSIRNYIEGTKLFAAYFYEIGLLK